MPEKPSPTRPGAPPVVAGLVLAIALLLGGWWVSRRASDARLAARAVALAPASLPAPEAPIVPELADLGAELFRRRCSACHAIAGGARIGPDLASVTKRVTLPWIEAMLLRPDSMTRDDPYAAALKAAYDVQMKVPGRFGPAEARAVIEFLRRADGG